MDPFTIALATFGVQKLRGKSTKRALRDAAIVGGGSQLAGMAGVPGFQAFGQTGNVLAGQTLKQQLAGTTAGKGIASLVGTPDVGRDEAIAALKEQGSEITEDNIKKYIAQSGSGFKGMSTTGKVLSASAILPFLDSADDPKKPFDEEDYKQAYKEQSQKLEGAFVPATNTVPTMSEVIGSDMFYANQGGLATAIPKYNKGGINYLPSKIDHNENDVNNYVRAEGYVEDGAGAGNKDEDTMLAQLADGEFVSRADAVLGAGILSGADPKSFKGMRKAGADFFYDQQKKFKRIYDLINASKQN
tara:strand:- start:481 stop:1386 length:906 start_codon:yes stop_codon:yes gene_type:complete